MMAGLYVTGATVLTSCNDDKGPRWMEGVSIEAVDGWTRAPKETELKLRVKLDEGEIGRGDTEGWTVRWTVDGVEAAGDSVLVLRESISLWQAVGGALILGFTLWNEISPPVRAKS